MQTSNTAKIQVAIRKRPLNSKELSRNENDIININNNYQVTMKEQRQKVDLTKYIEEHDFFFDRSFDETTTNEEIYLELIRPLVQIAFNKGKVTCLAYGQTGSGKTFTMMGNQDPNSQQSIPGLYLLAAQDIFNLLQNPQFSQYQIFVSFYEIYCGKLYDLLNEKKIVYARQDANKDVQICGLVQKQILNVHTLMQLIEFGMCNRASGQTAHNDDSSRSHGILEIHLKSGSTTQGKLSFIDLAGSERASDVQDQNKQTRLDGAEINKSLLALKECIRALDQEKKHLPFRGSKLTLVLRDSFIAKNCRTVFIGNISPGQQCSEHTLNTLRYADRVKELKSGNSQKSTNSFDKLSNQLMLSRQTKNSKIIMQNQQLPQQQIQQAPQQQQMSEQFNANQFQQQQYFSNVVQFNNFNQQQNFKKQPSMNNQGMSQGGGIPQGMNQQRMQQQNFMNNFQNQNLFDNEMEEEEEYIRPNEIKNQIFENPPKLKEQYSDFSSMNSETEQMKKNSNQQQQQQQQQYQGQQTNQPLQQLNLNQQQQMNNQNFHNFTPVGNNMNNFFNNKFQQQNQNKMAVNNNENQQPIIQQAQSKINSKSMQGQQNNNNQIIMEKQPIQQNSMSDEQDLENISKKHAELISIILQEEEEIITSHRKHIDDMVDLTKQEMMLLHEVDKPGSDVDNYVNTLNDLLNKKLDQIGEVKQKLAIFQQHLREEDNLSNLFQEKKNKVMNVFALQAENCDQQNSLLMDLK